MYLKFWNLFMLINENCNNKRQKNIKATLVLNIKK